MRVSWQNLLLSLIERYLQIQIARNPIAKYYNNFITSANLDVVSQSTGVLHIGAHTGQESIQYAELGVPVIFIEAHPDVHENLKKNIACFTNQQSFNILLGDEEREVDFFCTNNDSQSSSIFKLLEHPSTKGVLITNKLSLPMRRLDRIFSLSELQRYDHWVLDVQGAELLVLKGAGKLLDLCKTLFVECSTFQLYENGVMWHELDAYLGKMGFRYFMMPKGVSHMNVLFYRVGTEATNESRSS